MKSQKLPVYSACDIFEIFEILISLRFLAYSKTMDCIYNEVCVFLSVINICVSKNTPIFDITISFPVEKWNLVCTFGRSKSKTFSTFRKREGKNNNFNVILKKSI